MSTLSGKLIDGQHIGAIRILFNINPCRGQGLSENNCCMSLKNKGFLYHPLVRIGLRLGNVYAQVT